MELYIILAAAIFLLSLKRKNFTIYIVAFIILFMIASMRGFEVGSDTRTYSDYYDMSTETPLASLLVLEPGWILLNIIAKLIFHEYRGVLILTQLVALSLIFSRLWKSSKNPMFGILFYILLYYYLNSFNTARQAIALSIIFYSYPNILTKSRKFILYILLAASFHYSAIFCLITPFLKNLRFDSLSWTLILISTFVIGVIVGRNLVNYIPAFGKYTHYLSNQIEDGGFSMTRLILNFLFIFLHYILKPNPYIRVCLIGIIIYNLMTFSPAIGRMAQYFMIPQILLFSNLNCRHKSDYIFAYSTVLIYGVINYINLLNANSSEVVPYTL